MLLIKNLIFWLFFSLHTLFFFMLLVLSAVLPARLRHNIGTVWSKGVVGLLKHIIGLDYRVEGVENIPNEPTIVCCKHQSGYETLALQAIFPQQVFVLKRELFYIPVFGQGLMLMSPIAINRKSPAKATKQILEQGQKRKDKGFWITIFPEGTRIKPGEKGKYKSGAARMAQQLQMNMLPVAVNSGLYWPKNSFLKYPGTVTFSIQEPIAWDLGSIDEMMKQCENRIETAQAKIESAVNQS
ncbi:MAG: 1-acyl-sn-glycerol-3-phosphate acyltransferase [Neisseriaceae bacterium]|nr:1-acyl-sn-glycerol-3-phosphate acyltransferase [Neisseriaceae bacterium]